MAAPRDFLLDLHEQLDFLVASIDRFDEGHQHEAKRIATTIRVLVSPAGQTPLLRELHALDEIPWFSLGEDYHPANLAPTNSLVAMQTKVIEGGMEASYVPRDLTWGLERWVSFEDWWRKTPVIHNPGSGHSFRRMNLVALLANRDGGAHVGRLDSKERQLVANELTPWGIGWDDGEEVQVNLSPVPASMRAMATEVLMTMKRYGESIGVDLVPRLVNTPPTQ